MFYSLVECVWWAVPGKLVKSAKTCTTFLWEETCKKLLVQTDQYTKGLISKDFWLNLGTL